MLVKKPRLKKDGKEVQLESYKALRGYDVLCERIQEHMIRGVSTRDYEPLLDEISSGAGLKKSAVSKAFVKASRGSLEAFNARDLSEQEFVAIMLDGVGFGNRTVVVALGIDIKGKKHILGLREGSSENWELCRDLLESLVARGLQVDEKYLFIIDGSKALKKAIQKVFGKEFFIQRCVRHKERNIIQYLPKDRHQEFRRRWRKLNGCVDFFTAKREYGELAKWLEKINHAALNSLEEGGMDLLTVMKFNIPPLLRKTLSSTNPIESAFSYTQYRVGRVKNWRSGTDQVGRWAATMLLHAEEKFRTVKGFMQLPKLKKMMNNFELEKQTKVA